MEFCPLCKKAVVVCMCVAVVGGSALPEANTVAIVSPQSEVSQALTPRDQDNREDEPTAPQPNRIITVAASTTVSAGTFEVVKFTTPGWPPGSSDAD
jgi:hypothetical protein